ALPIYRSAGPLDVRACEGSALALLRARVRRLCQRTRPPYLGTLRALDREGAPERGPPVPREDSARAARPGRAAVQPGMFQVGAPAGGAPADLGGGPRHRV